MSVTVEKLDNLQRKIILSLPWEAMHQAIQSRLKAAQKRARVSGFRPGKAPLRMVESMYGAEIRDEVLNKAAEEAFLEAVKSADLRVVGYPKLEALEEQNDPAVFNVTATFEVYPEVVIGDLSGQEVTRFVSEVGEEEVNKTIEILRKQRTRFERVERAAAKDDRVIVDFEGKIDGALFDGGSSTNQAFIVGSGAMLPEFEAGVIGMKEGESKDVNVPFPDDYHAKEVAGKTAVFTIKVNNVAEAILPEVDAEFAKALGIEGGDLTKMRAEIKKNVTREVARRVKEQTKTSVFAALSRAVPVDVPSAIIAMEADRLAEQMKQNLAQQGMDVKNFQLPEGLFTEQAKERASLGIILNALVEQEKLQASDEEIKALVTELADSYENPQEVIEWYLSDKKNLEGPSSLATEENIIAYVLSRAKVTEKMLSFDEVMNQQQAQ